MRTLVVALMCCTTLVVPARRAAAHDPKPHVRALDACAASAVSNGLARSMTVRQLGDRLARTDVVAYVRCVWPDPGVTDGALVWVSGASSLRYVLLSLSHALTPLRRVEILAHELQHAIEVSDAPWVRDEATLQRLFEGIGRRTSPRPTYETMAAQAVERVVREDMAAPPPPALPADVLLADASRPASVSDNGSPAPEGGSFAPGAVQQREVRVGLLPQIEERGVALKTLPGTAQPGVRPSLPKQRQRNKD